MLIGIWLLITSPFPAFLIALMLGAIAYVWRDDVRHQREALRK